MLEGKIVGFVPTRDSKKARSFYEGKLGFQFVSDDQFALVVKGNGNTIRIAKGADFKPASYTVLGWEVKNIESTVKALKKNGVEFESYPFIQDRKLMIWTTPNGDKVAWFKDPDWNVLSVSQHV